MLGNIFCWVIAIALILTNHPTMADLYTKLLFALGFIFLGILSKTSDYYREVHSKKDDKKTVTTT